MCFQNMGWKFSSCHTHNSCMKYGHYQVYSDMEKYMYVEDLNFQKFHFHFLEKLQQKKNSAA